MLMNYAITEGRPFFLLLAILLLQSACRPVVQEMPEAEKDPASEEFVQVNRYMFQRHQDHISAFLDRVGWPAEATPSGLWIYEEEAGSGRQIREGDQVTYAFESMLLDGTACYQASRHNPKIIQVGKGGVESGVEEGLQQLSEGSRAVLLIPPHLGHGNFGDRDRIPGNSVLIYRIHVLRVDPG